MAGGWHDLFGITVWWKSAGAEPTPPAPGETTEVITLDGYQPNKLTLAIFDTTHVPFAARAMFRGNFQKAVSAWSFAIGANGGYKDGSFTFMDTRRSVKDWFEKGLGRHVECYNPSHSIIWAGFVNKIRISFGTLSAERGPLMDVSNRVSAIYTPLDITVYPPVQGITKPTPIVEDAASQSAYGIIERILNAGTIPDADAEQIRDTFLEENKDPETNNAALMLGGAQALSITVECLGYSEWLRAYVYNQTAISTSVTITSKIQTVLAADPNGIFSTDYNLIATNNYLVGSYEDGNRDAQTIIESMLSIGDINDNRYLFGIYANQRASYQSVPTTIEYQQHLTERKQIVRTIEGKDLYPWDVKPGKFLKYADFPLGRVTPNQISRGNPNLMFIEEMRFTAPFTVQISGGKWDKLPQKLAKWGLGGM